jgi:hypothetical protein
VGILDIWRFLIKYLSQVIIKIKQLKQGWWASPANWKRNGIIYSVVCVGISWAVFNYSAKHTVEFIILLIFDIFLK